MVGQRQLSASPFLAAEIEGAVGFIDEVGQNLVALGSAACLRDRGVGNQAFEVRGAPRGGGGVPTSGDHFLFSLRNPHRHTQHAKGPPGKVNTSNSS